MTMLKAVKSYVQTDKLAAVITAGLGNINKS